MNIGCDMLHWIQSCLQSVNKGDNGSHFTRLLVHTFPHHDCYIMDLLYISYGTRISYFMNCFPYDDKAWVKHLSM